MTTCTGVRHLFRAIMLRPLPAVERRWPHRTVAWWLARAPERQVNSRPVTAHAASARTRAPEYRRNGVESASEVGRSPRLNGTSHGTISSRPRRAAEHPFSDRTLPEALPAAPPVGSKDDQIGFPRIGVQHNHASGIAVLLDGPNRDAFALGTFSQAGQKFEAFALVP